jgi:hypothetical protein
MGFDVVSGGRKRHEHVPPRHRVQRRLAAAEGISAILPVFGNRLSIMRSFRTQSYDLLTSVVKPIATAVWHCGGNRAATARRE